MANEFIMRKGYKSLANSEITGSLTTTGDIDTSGNLYLDNNKSVFAKNTSSSNYGLLTITSGNVIKLGAYSYTSAATQIGLGNNGTFLIGTETAFSIANNKNATFAGTVTAATAFIADAISGNNNDPGADNLQVSGYGLIGNRGNLYITNASTNSAAIVQIGVGGTHNAAAKLSIGVTNSSLSTNFKPGADSTYDIGSNASRWANVYADNLYGDGSNLTNVTGITPSNMVTTDTTQTITGAKTLSSLTLSNQNPAITLIDSSGSTYTAQWRFKDNKLQYLWGGGIKAYFTTDGLAIGDQDSSNDAQIVKTGSSPYGLAIKTNNIQALNVDSSQNATFAGTVGLSSNKSVNWPGGTIRAEGNTLKLTATTLIDLQEDTQIQGGLDIKQTSDSDGLQIFGYDDRAADSGNLYIDGSGNFQIRQTHGAGSGYMQIHAENYLELHASSLIYTQANFRIYDAGTLSFGSGGDYKIKHNTVADNLIIHTDDNKGITIDNAGNVTFTEDVVVAGKVTAQEFHTEFVSASIMYESGSTKFGDTSDDIHSFSGSLRVTGSGDHYFTDGNVGIGTDSPSKRLDIRTNGVGDGITLTTSTPKTFAQIINGNSETFPYGKFTMNYGDTTPVQIVALSNELQLSGGYTTGGKISFRTATSEQMRLTETGLGIGTTTPSHKLTVNAANNTTAVGIDFPSAHFDFSANSTSGYTSNFRLDNVGMDIGHDSTARSLNLQTGNLDRVTILGNGKVGIGTISPTNGQLVIDSTTNQIAIETGTAGDGRLNIGHFANGTFIGTYGDDGGAADLIRFGTHSGDERMRITSTGGISFGSTGTAYGTSGQVLTSAGNASPTWTTPTTGTVTGGGSNTYLAKWTTGSNINSSTMFQAASGNFSIGITTPNAKLSVVNDISIGTSATDVLRLSNISGVGAIYGFSSRNLAFGSITNGEVMRVDNTNERVGIGTTSPGFKLDVESTSVSVARFKSTGTKAVIYLSEADEGGLISTEANRLCFGSGAGVSTANMNYHMGTERLGIGTASPTAKLDIEGDLQVLGVNISNQENLDVDTGTETIATVVKATYDAAFFDFVIKNGTNLRAGTVFAIHDGTNVEFTETSTNDLGDTSGVTLSVDISGTDMRLRATTTTDNWIIKSLVRTL